MRRALLALFIVASLLGTAAGCDDKCKRPGDVKVSNGNRQTCVHTDNGNFWQ